MEISGRTLDEADGRASSEEGEIFCQPCRSDGDFVVAKGYCQHCNEYFCDLCLKLHRKQSLTRNHGILYGESMPKPQLYDVDVELCSELCHQHTNEIVKFFCSNHDAIGCSDCMIIDHKACNVERIQDISRSFFNGLEHRHLVGRVESILESLDELRKRILSADEDSSKTYSQSVTDIKAFRKEVNEYLDEVEAELLAEGNKWKTKIEKTLSKLQADQKLLEDEIKTLESKLKLRSNKTNELFVAAKQMKDKIYSVDLSIKQIMQEEINMKTLAFEPSYGLKKIVATKFPLGKLTEIIKLNRKLEEMVPFFEFEMDIKSSDDQSDCYITATALISPTELILVDSNNDCLKMINIEHRKLFIRYNMPSRVDDVTIVSRNIFAVTLPDENIIKFLYISKNNKLNESHFIKMNGNVSRIACQSDYLLVGYFDKVELLTMKGKVIKAIISQHLTCIVKVAFAPDGKAFYVSNNPLSAKDEAAVYKFDLDGNLLATYKDKTLSDVRGLSVTPDGTLLVCNWTDSGSIHMISPDCTKIKELLKYNEHVQRPYCISFCSKTNTIFLCSNDYALSSQNILKIFLLM